MSAQYYEGIGRRKSASARVRLFPGGTGRFIINGKDGVEYLPRLGDMQSCLAPLTHIGQERSYDVSVHVNGGASRANVMRSCSASPAPWRRSILICAYAQGRRFPFPRCAREGTEETRFEARRKAPTYTKR